MKKKREKKKKKKKHCDPRHVDLEGLAAKSGVGSYIMGVGSMASRTACHHLLNTLTLNNPQFMNTAYTRTRPENLVEFPVGKIFFISDVHVQERYLGFATSVSQQSIIETTFRKKYWSTLVGFDPKRDLIVILGDATNMGTIHEKIALKDYFYRLGRVPADRLIICPGNHDISTFIGNLKYSPKKLEVFVKAFYQPKAKKRDLSGKSFFPVQFKVAPNCDLIILNSAVPLGKYHFSEGSLGEKQLKDLEALLEDAKLGRRKVILCLHHHPLLPNRKSADMISDIWGVLFENVSKLKDWKEFEVLVKRFEGTVKYVLFGHQHLSYQEVKFGAKYICVSGGGKNWMGLADKEENRGRRLEEAKLEDFRVVLRMDQVNDW